MQVIVFRRSQISFGLADIAQMAITDGKIFSRLHNTILLNQLLGDIFRLLVGPLCGGQIGQFLQIVAQRAQRGIPGQPIVHRAAFLKPYPPPICQFLLPLNRCPVIPRHTVAAAVHIHQLFHGLRQTALRRADDEGQGAFAVYLYINPVQVGKPDEEIVLRRAVVLLDSQMFHRRQ